MIKIVKGVFGKVPTKNFGDAGYDLYSAEPVHVMPRSQITIDTDIRISIPAGHVGLIWDKSGYATKSGISVMGGVIDSTYRGVIKVCLRNHSDEPFFVQRHQKIAQILFQKVEDFDFIEVEELDSTIRGTGGFGSTGDK